MLTPNDLQAIANDLTDIYANVETECIRTIVDRITAGKKITQAAVWQMKKLDDMGLLRRELIREVGKSSRTALPKVEQLVNEALSRSVGVDVKKLRQSLKKSDEASVAERIATLQASPAFRKLLKNTMAGVKDIMNLTGTKAVQGSLAAYRDAVNTAYLEMASGNYTYEQAVSRAVGRIGKNGVRIVEGDKVPKDGALLKRNGTAYTTYTSGRIYPLDSAIRRDLTTAINQACGELTLETCGELDCQYVETSWHIGARPEHEVWQGRIFSLNPNDTKYPYFYAPQEAGGCGYGDMLGICGINCYHSFNPWFEGSPRSTQEGKPSAAENARIYKEQQQQRSYERSLRGLKREQIAYREAGMTDKAQEVQRRINETSARYRGFLKETGRERVTMLEKVPGYRPISTKA